MTGSCLRRLSWQPRSPVLVAAAFGHQRVRICANATSRLLDRHPRFQQLVREHGRNSGDA